MSWYVGDKDKRFVIYCKISKSYLNNKVYATGGTANRVCKQEAKIEGVQDFRVYEIEIGAELEGGK